MRVRVISIAPSSGQHAGDGRRRSPMRIQIRGSSRRLHRLVWRLRRDESPLRRAAKRAGHPVSRFAQARKDATEGSMEEVRHAIGQVPH